MPYRRAQLSQRIWRRCSSASGSGGNPAGLPVQVLSICTNFNDTAAVNSFIAQHGLDPKFVLKDTSYVFSTYGKGYVPQFALISGVTNGRFQGAAVPQWQVLWTQTGYGAGGYQTIRAKIDAITVVPEPATIGLLACAALLLRRRTR